MEKPQWKYFGQDHEFFEDAISNSPRNTPCRDIALYRRILYTFSVNRRFITFRFTLNREDPNRPAAIDFQFISKRHRKNFYNMVHGSINYNTMQHDSVRIMINNYFFQFLNDLLSISQCNGHRLLPQICPPLLVKRYYCAIVISRIIYQEYVGVMNSKDKSRNFIKEVDNFLNRPYNYLSYTAVSRICKILSEQYGMPEDLKSSIYLKMGGTIYKEVCREFLYLLNKTNETGPVLNVIQMDYVEHLGSDNDSEPEYIRLQFNADETLEAKYRHSAYALKEWKELKLDWLGYDDEFLEKHTIDKVDIDSFPMMNYRRVFAQRDSKTTEVVEIQEQQAIENINDVARYEEVVEEVVFMDIPQKNGYIEFLNGIPEKDDTSIDSRPKSQTIPVARVEPNPSNNAIDSDIDPKLKRIKSPGLTKKQNGTFFLDKKPLTRKFSLSNVSETLIFKAVTKKLINFMESDYYKNHCAIDGEKSKALTLLEKKCLLIFLHENRFLCELHNPMLWETLKVHKFLNRTSIVVYNNFVRELRGNLSYQIENIFKNVNDCDLLLSVYDKLRNNFG